MYRTVVLTMQTVKTSVGVSLKWGEEMSAIKEQKLAGNQCNLLLLFIFIVQHPFVDYACLIKTGGDTGRFTICHRNGNYSGSCSLLVEKGYKRES